MSLESQCKFTSLSLVLSFTLSFLSLPLFKFSSQFNQTIRDLDMRGIEGGYNILIQKNKRDWI